MKQKTKKIKTMHGIVAVVFRERAGKKEFLLLHRVLNWTGWEVPKGSIDEKEDFEDAAKREIFEETGIKKILAIKNLRAIYRFFDPVRKCNREMHGFLVKVDSAAKVSFEYNDAAEHDAFEWAGAQTALQKLTYAAQKSFFKKALAAFEKVI